MTETKDDGGLRLVSLLQQQRRLSNIVTWLYLAVGLVASLLFAFGVGGWVLWTLLAAAVIVVSVWVWFEVRLVRIKREIKAYLTRDL